MFYFVKNRVEYLKKIFSYHIKQSAFYLRHLLRIVPTGGNYKFSSKYFSKRYFTGQRSKKREEAEHAKIASMCRLGVVEIGVLKGETSRILASANPGIPVYGIDPIIVDSMSETMIGNENVIKNNTREFKNFTFIKDYSFNVVKSWNKPIDYLFIDGSHFYEDVKRDFEDWLPFVVSGGLISFHDSTMYRGGMEYWPGPSKLADELIFDDRVEFVSSIARLTIFRKR